MKAIRALFKYNILKVVTPYMYKAKGEVCSIDLSEVTPVALLLNGTFTLCAALSLKYRKMMHQFRHSECWLVAPCCILIKCLGTAVFRYNFFINASLGKVG